MLQFGRKTLCALSAAAVLLASLSGCANAAAAANEQEAPAATAVEVREMQKTSLESRQSFIGRVEPAVTMSVISKLSAEVTAVNVEVGQRVEAGDVLFTVDAGDLQDQIRQLQATLAAQDAGIATARVGIEQAQYGLERAQNGSAQTEISKLQSQSGVESAREAVRSANDQLSNAKSSRKQARAAVEQANAELAALTGSGAAEEEITAAIAALAVAEAKEAAADAGVDAAETGLSMAERALELAQDTYPLSLELIDEGKDTALRQAQFGVRQATLGVEQAEKGRQVYDVQLAIAQDKLSYAEIRSPIAGVVSMRDVEAGQMVGASMSPITIVDLDTVNIRVGVAESLVNLIKASDKVDVLVQAVSATPFAGEVTVVHPVASQTGTYTVEIAIPNPDGAIRPGMFAQASFVKAASSDALVLPRSAVLEDGQQQYVYVAADDGTAVKTAVSTGITDGVNVVIESGLSQGDKVVVTGQEYLRDGVQVNVVALK